jgi:hypothetical protein
MAEEQNGFRKECSITDSNILLQIINGKRMEYNLETRRFLSINPSAWGHLNPSSYCDVGRLFYGVFKLWSKL